jgi:hypothetical protein
VIPANIHVVALHLHLGTMAQQTGDHRCNFRGTASFQLRIDTDRFAFHMPVDEHPRTTITGMPFGHQILVPGSEFLGVGGACRGALAPDVGKPNAEDGIGHVSNRRSQRIFGEKATADVEHIAVTLAKITCADPFETDITVMWNILIRCIEVRGIST